MYSIRAFLCFMLFFFSALANAHTLTIAHWQTHQGTPVFFVSSPSLPMLDVRVIFAAGSSNDGPYPGLASLTNNLLGEGTTQLTADQIANRFDQVGAVCTNDVDKDMANLSLRTLTDKKYLPSALATFETVLAQATFSTTSFQQIIAQTNASIQDGLQTPDTVALNAFNVLLYGSQAYAHPVLGTTASLQKLTPELVQHFYKKYYTARNADIILVGNISRQEAVTIANDISDKLPLGTTIAALPLMQSYSPTLLTEHIPFPSKQTSVVLGQRGITRDDPNYYSLVVGNTILGELPMTSLLFQEVRNKRGLAYDVDSNLNALRSGGAFTIQLKTRANKVADSIAIVKKTVNDFSTTGPTDSELTDAKQYLDGSFPMAINSNSGMMDVVSILAFYHRPINYLDTYLGHINSVTKDQVKQAMFFLLHKNDLILVTVGPKHE